GIRDFHVTGVQTCALPIYLGFIGTGRQGTGLVKTFLKTGEVQCLAASDVYSAKLTNFLEQINKFYEEGGQGKKEGCASYSDFRRSEERRVGKEWKGR